MTANPIGPLLGTVFNSILEVFLLCCAGYLLAGRGVLDKKTQKQLNRLNVSLFTPALLFSKVAFFLSPAKLRELWVIPIFFIIVTVVSMAVAYILGVILRIKRSQRAFAMASAMFMNSNSLPIALMQSLVVTVPGLKWYEGDNKNAMVGRALTYLVLYSTLGMVLRWSYGVRLLSQADDEVSPVDTDDEPSERTPLLIESLAELEREDAGPPPMAADSAGLRPRPRLPVRRRTTYYRSFPNSPTASRVDLPSISTPLPSASPTSSDDEYDDTAPGTSAGSSATLPMHHEPSKPLQEPQEQERATGIVASTRRGARHMRRAWAAFTEFMTAPLWAAAASVVVACVRPLQHLLEMHVQPIKGALTQAGNCSIPLTLVVLGAYFYKEDDKKSSSSGGIKGMARSVRNIFRREWWARRRSGGGERTKELQPGETKTVIIAVLSRMVLTPLVLMPLMALAAKYDWHDVFEDPVFVVSNVLLVSSPPALTLAQITQAASGDSFERLISKTIFWSYCIVTPPATILYVVIGLMLSKI
ncbi:membrane transport protein-domain-containing protein [Schizophyllum amplum]|uniref:Membrane transport protein-domain-containing protein n=1 Tax=Schizophyllum amplum TaxID=97359 RepID=A0A550CHZ0_9AGAR|nr:membrane transport protein-domain-containing protein [Auriculariopsis ampla]